MLYIITISLIKNPTLKTGLFIKKSFDKGTFLVDEHELEEQFSSSHLDKHCTMWRLQITRTAGEGCMVILVTGVPPLPLQLASHTLQENSLIFWYCSINQLLWRILGRGKENQIEFPCHRQLNNLQRFKYNLVFKFSY